MNFLPDNLHTLSPTLLSAVACATVAALSVLLWALWLLRWRDYVLLARWQRLPRSTSATDEDQHFSAERSAVPFSLAPKNPRVSVVVLSCNEADALRRNLPHFLGQDFDAFEVIVVDLASTDETRELVEHLSETHANLRLSFVPASSRQIDRRKLAITLGIRASHAPWTVVTTATSRPASQHWLAALAEAFTSEHDFVLAYANFETDGTSATRRAIFERLMRTLMRARAAIGMGAVGGRKAALERGLAFGADAANFAIRNDFFMQCKGFAESLTVPCGEDDLLVDATAQAGRTAVVASAEAVVVEDAPIPAVIQAHRTALCETQRHFSWRGKRFLWRETLASLSLYIFIALVIFGALISAVIITRFSFAELLSAPSFVESCPAFYAMAAAAVLWTALLAAAFAIPTISLRRSTNAVREMSFSAPLLLHYALAAPWRRLACRYRHFRHRREFERR